MIDVLLARAPKKTIPLTLLTKMDVPAWLKRQPARTRQWVETQSFKGTAGTFCTVPDANGNMVRVVAGLSSPPSLWDIAELPLKLPHGAYTLDWEGPLAFHEWLALGWQLGAYNFTRYKKSDIKYAQLVLSAGSDQAKIRRYAEAIADARDLINTPAEDLGPDELAKAIIAVGKKYRAKVTQIIGDALLKKNYPAVHTVGRASSRAPRLVDLTWGNSKHPRVTLVGKGVCFDTGGLDIKPPSNMYLMKKDMGGAACALAVAKMIMDAKLPVRLRLMIPAVENSISANAFRPSDVITMRNGTTVEVGNTDAEGRLILADALAEGAREKPRLLIDFSTLTGAARVAVGPEISAFFCNDDDLAARFMDAATQMEDPFWRLPLHQPYGKLLDSKTADLNSAPDTGFAGAITAALFLEYFVAPVQHWAHIDFMAWNVSAKAGRPQGGEAMAVRTAYRVIETMFAR